MQIKEFQKRVLQTFSEISKKPNRKPHTNQTAVIHLMEEVGEIAREITNESHRPEKFSKDNLGTELADTLMFIVLLADIYDVDLDKEILRAIERLEKKANPD
jgi:NTP pyrophosphatase (non-canonical NTP hydrolase)